MLSVTPNFHFNGQCKQAIKLYEKAFGAKVKYLMSYSDANPDDYIAHEGFKDYVYHSEVFIGNQRMMLTDSPNKPINNISVKDNRINLGNIDKILPVLRSNDKITPMSFYHLQSPKRY